MRRGRMGRMPPGTPTEILDELGPVPPPPGWPPAGWPPSGWPPSGWPRSGWPAGGLRRSLCVMIPWIAAAALAAAVIGVVVLRGSPARHAASHGAPTPAATPSRVSKVSPRHAAARLSALLSQSVTDRGAVINAVVDVRACGTSLRQDARVFAGAASSRARLLSRLGNLPGRSVLPAAMLRDLAGAWQSSAQADADLARWANDKIASGCHGAGLNASLQASYSPDGLASADKRAFARLWDPVARPYGLTTYQWDQL